MVKRSLPRTDDIWIHFKGNEYKIITIAEHTETKEKFVYIERCTEHIKNMLDLWICL